MRTQSSVRYDSSTWSGIKEMMRSGDLEQIHCKWFLRPIPPRNAVLSIPMSDSLRAAFASWGDGPAEAYDHK